MTEKPGWVDAHAHVFHRGLPLASSRRYAPDYDAPLDAYLAMLDKHGIAFGVLVQPSFLGTDNSFLLDSLKAANGRLRGVAVVPETTPREELRRLASAGVTGVRLNLIGTPIPNFNATAWVEFFRRLDTEDIHVELQCRCAEASGILSTLSRYNRRIVLDHFGLPENADPDRAEGLRAILRFGKRNQVYVKVSAPYRFLEDDRVPSVRPFFRAFLDAFGLDHLLWGSDWPHTQFEGRGNTDRALQAITALAPDTNTLSAIMGGTARALYGFKPARR